MTYHKKQILAPLATLLLLVFLYGCMKEEGVGIVTKKATKITSNSAETGGKVTSSGGNAITSFGVCWATHSKPTILDNRTIEQTGYSDFVSKLTGLSRATRYYVRAYATNKVGIVYGPVITFTTNSVNNITTTAVKKFTQNMALSGGKILDLGDTSEIIRGVCWSTSPEPTINDNKTIDGTGSGVYQSVLTGLTKNTNYYVKAYALYDYGINYGEQVEFTTLPDGIAIDIQGNQYATTVINDQEWITQNLMVMKYDNGELIPSGLANSVWSQTTKGSSAAYPYASLEGINSIVELRNAYGLLYNWHTVSDNRKICPFGWRVPTVEDWMELISFVGNEGSNLLKSCRQINSPLGGECATIEHPRWNENSEFFGTDNYSFSANPAGLRKPDGAYSSIGSKTSFWALNENDSATAISVSIYYNSGIIDTLSVPKTSGLSIRCIKEQ